MRAKLALFCTLCLVFINNCSGSSSDSPASPDAGVQATQLTFPGVSTGGIFDPSITKDPSTGFLWMSYSAVNNSTMWPTQNTIAVNIRLAYSQDSGITWTDAGAVNQFNDVNISILTAPNNAGTWVHEVSTLIYDPGAATNQKWKLMFQSFLKINGSPRFEHSWISMKMASTPQGLAAATTSKLFTYYLYDTNNNSGAAPTAPPITGAAAIQLDTAVSSALNTCMFSEPSLLATASALYLAIQCEQINSVSTTADEDRLIVLLKCNHPCDVSNTASWTYITKIFSKADAVAVDPKFTGGFAAPSLVTSSAGTYLIVTPAVDPDAVYRGCRVYKFSDLDTGQLEKENGQPRLVTSSGPTSDIFNGACSYIGGSNSGLLRSELGQQSPPWDFKILMTKITF